MFRLLRYFTLTSLAAFIIVIVLLNSLFYKQATEDLIQVEERKNIAVTRALANAIHSQLDAFISQSAGLSGQDLLAHEQMSDFRTLILTQLEGQSVVKVKVYNLDGITVFSTENTQIGEDQSQNDGFLTALGGQVASKLTHRDKFNAFDGEIEDRDVLSSYIPLFTHDQSGQVEGIVEVYSDLTPWMKQTAATQRTLLITIAAVQGLLFIFLYFIIRRADKIIGAQADDLQQAKDAAENANLAKSEFISFVTHELRNPITVVRSYADLLYRGVNKLDASRQRKYLEAVRRGADRMTTLTSDLMDISRMELGVFELKVETVDVPEIIEEVTQSLRKLIDEKEQFVRLELAGDLPKVNADRGRLVQVMANLVSNAHKYTPSGGEIKVTANPVQVNDHQQMRISVQDNGIGINEGDQGRIFQRFFRSEDDQARMATGTGLGLYLSKNLVEMQGGTIWFESEFRRGSTFHFTVPLMQS